MIQLSDDRLRNVTEYALTHGIEKASLNFSLKQETITRYIRQSKIKGLIKDDEIVFDKRPNVLVLDIETAPAKAGIWGLWNNFTNIDQVKSDWFMLTWSAKWLYEADVYSDKLIKEEALCQDDKRICETMWEFIDFADVVIAHNGDKFDLPRLNTRFLLNGIAPPSSYRSIDTLKIAKRHFGFLSNKLDFISRRLGVGGKIDTGGYETWDKIIWEGDEAALAHMEEYNKNDVLILEEVYVALRPWVKSHVNMALYYDDIGDRCPNCGEKTIKYMTGKYYYTPMNKYSEFRCDCGAVGRSRSSALTTKERSELLSPTAR